MEMSLFSSFDPSVVGLGHAKWLSGVVIFVFVLKYFATPTSVGVGIMSVMAPLFSSLKEGLTVVKNKSLVIVSVFFVILLNVEMGFAPFSFVLSSQMSFNLSLGFPLWLGGLVFSCLLSWKGVVAHLTPLGSPVALSPALVLIELISMIIRPLTLSVRLMANVVAGHMIVSLIEGAALSGPLFTFPSILAQSGLMMFEMVVSVVQAYVFSSLIFLYWKEAEQV